MGRRSQYPPEVRERAVRLVFEQQASHDSPWSAIGSIASKRKAPSANAWLSIVVCGIFSLPLLLCAAFGFVL